MAAHTDKPLQPPVRYSKPKNWMLKTVGEAIDYIDEQLTDDQRNHDFVKTARNALYNAGDTGERADVAAAREALAMALRSLKVGGN
jgi:hypothetical protein